MIRNTKQRQAILAAIEEAARPLTANEVHELGLQTSAKLGLRTVFRNLRELVEERRLVVVDYPGQPPRYEVVDGQHHTHFICHKCQKMYTFEEEAPDVPYTAPPGFKITGEEVIFYGLCPKCGGRKK